MNYDNNNNNNITKPKKKVTTFSYNNGMLNVEVVHEINVLRKLHSVFWMYCLDVRPEEICWKKGGTRRAVVVEI